MSCANLLQGSEWITAQVVSHIEFDGVVFTILHRIQWLPQQILYQIRWHQVTSGCFPGFKRLHKIAGELVEDSLVDDGFSLWRGQVKDIVNFFT